ncbi:MAG: winged helix-turn-helix domain-containing protein [Chloroflexi bacterium]|nr:winged helix-turn-helix domain-containing protein [Chloroflexota bacterium]
MDAITAALSDIPGAVFAVDADLRVVAWNQGAEQGLQVPAREAIGRACYEVVPAVDVESGRPCYERCPLVQGTSRYGWAYNRVLRAAWAGGKRVRLDCFLFKCVFPDSLDGTLCFVGPQGAAEADAQSRALEALEDVYPAVARSGDPQDTLRSALGAVLRATGAETVQLYTLDSDAHALVLFAQMGANPDSLEGFARSALSREMLDLVGRSQVPVLISRARGVASPESTEWAICVPLQAEERVLGALVATTNAPRFNVGVAARVLFPVAVQLSVYLRWAYSTHGQVWPPSSRGATSLPEARRLEFYCFGSFRLMRNGMPVPTAGFHRLKSLSLLKYLVAHRGRPISRDQLIEVLWPESDPARAGNNLRVVLHDLRRALEAIIGPQRSQAVLRNEGDMVFLDPSDSLWVDVEEFVSTLRRAGALATRGLLDEALAEMGRLGTIYCGDFLADEPYSDWCLAEREQLREVYLHQWERLGALLAEQGRSGDAEEAYRAALGLDPIREDIHRRLMGVLWRSGKKDEALRQFELCRTVLRREIGVAPSEETQALVRSMTSAPTPR